MKPTKSKSPKNSLPRRAFVRDCMISASALTILPVLGCRTSNGQVSQQTSGHACRTFALDNDCLLGGKLTQQALSPGFADSSFAKVPLPHWALQRSWQNWDWKDWQEVWCYRRHFLRPESF